MATNTLQAAWIAGAAQAAASSARTLKGAWAALTTGSRAIPLGDNGRLYQELAARIKGCNRRS